MVYFCGVGGKNVRFHLPGIMSFSLQERIDKAFIWQEHQRDIIVCASRRPPTPLGDWCLGLCRAIDPTSHCQECTYVIPIALYFHAILFHAIGSHFTCFTFQTWAGVIFNFKLQLPSRFFNSISRYKSIFSSVEQTSNS